MKTFRTLAALAVLAFTLPALAHSGMYSTYTYSAAMTSGAAANSDVIDGRDLESLSVVFSAATADRIATVVCLAADKTTTLYSFPAITAAFAGQAQQMIYMYPDAVVPATAPTGTTIWNVPLCPWMQVQIPSAAGTGQLDIIGRRQQVAAEVSKCPGTTDRTNPMCYESGSVTAGAALSTGVIDTRRVEGVTILVEATTTNRAMVLACTDSAGTVLFNFASFTVTAASKYMHVLHNDSAIPGTEPTGITHLPLSPCRFMKATVAAAGAASAKLASYVR